MRGIPTEKKQIFKAAANSFQGEGAVVVTDSKLEKFLKETAEIEIPEEEKLRQIAIALEFDDFEDGWNGFRQIYKKAAEINPTDSYVFHSWGISARHWFENISPTKTKLSIFAEAEKVLMKAFELEPKSSDIAYSLGCIYYNHPEWCENYADKLNKAISWFSLAIELDAQNVMAQLYLAHCYHDFAYHLDETYWEKARNAYEKVDQNLLSLNYPKWRALKCREQIATCYAWCGKNQAAIDRFSKFLDEIEGFELDEFDSYDDVVNIDELVDTLIKKLHNKELWQRTKAQVKRYGFESRYKELLSENLDLLENAETHTK